MKTYAIRLTKGQDLKKELIKFTKENNLKAGCIISCAGHLTRATLRMADARIIKDYEEEFEIVALSGTLCKDDVHLHVALSNKKGEMIGGHVKDNCLIGVTAEIVIGDLENLEFRREFDNSTGYNELRIIKK